MAASAPVSHTRVLAGLVLGAAVGCLANYLVTREHLANEALEPAARSEPVKAVVAAAIKYVAGPVGDIFMNLLFLAIIPLVFASLVLGVTRLGGTANVGRIGAKTLAYFLITTAFAATIGLVLVNTIRPGDRLSDQQKQKLEKEFGGEAAKKLEKKSEFGIGTLVNVVPRYPLKAFVESDMLAVIFTSLLVGIALTQMPADKSKPVVDLLEAVNLITDFVIRLAMKLAPYAVFALIFKTTASFGYEILLALGAFVGTVLGGLAIHQFVVLPILVATLGGMSPLVFFRKVRGVMVTAFSTSSSSATLPTAIQCAEEELDVPPAVSRFVLPLSASMNHNGTALFEAVTALFLAQVFGKNLGLEEQLVVLVLCILTATGMAGVPGGSLPLIGLVLATVGVEPGLIAIVLGVDRILDMCRTTVNVTADMTTAVFIARTERGRGDVPA